MMEKQKKARKLVVIVILFKTFGPAPLFCALEPGFWSRPVLGRLRLRESSTRSRLRLLVKENKSLDFFKTDYKLSKLRSKKTKFDAP